MATSAEYRERLLPRWWVWLLSLGLMGMLGVAYGGALGAQAGWSVAILGGTLVAALLWITSPRIEVREGALTVGRAALPFAAVKGAVAVDETEIATLRGPGADGRLFVALRPWSCRGGVLVTLSDETDPHPAWLFSSRHPVRVVEVLAATMGR